MGTPAIFAPAYTFVDGQLDTFLNARLNGIITQVAAPLRIALVLYITLYGIAILRGSINEPITDFAVRSIKLGLIYSLATTAAYSSWVTQPLFHVLPDTLAQAISGSTANNIGSSFDKFLGYGGMLAQKTSDAGNVANIGAYVVSGVIFVVTVLVTALGFGVAMIAKVALALLVALGPIFIACALFDATRRYFFGWLSQAVNYLVLFALIITVFEMVLALVQQQWPAIDGQSNAEVAGMLFSALCVLGAIFFLQTPAIAAGIAGGASAGLSDFGTAGAALMKGKPAPSTPSMGLPPPAQSGGSMRQLGSSSTGGGSLRLLPTPALPSPASTSSSR